MSISQHVIRARWSKHVVQENLNKLLSYFCRLSKRRFGKIKSQEWLENIWFVLSRREDNSTQLLIRASLSFAINTERCLQIDSLHSDIVGKFKCWLVGWFWCQGFKGVNKVEHACMKVSFAGEWVSGVSCRLEEQAHPVLLIHSSTRVAP